METTTVNEVSAERDVFFPAFTDDHEDVTSAVRYDDAAESDHYVIRRLGNFSGLSDDAIVTLAQLWDEEVSQ
jgi:hypothetical protein